MSARIGPGSSIEVETLRRWMTAEEAPETLRLLDARPGEEGRAAYHERHLAGAVHADMDRDLAAPAPKPERGGRHPLPRLEDWAATLGRWGIEPGTRVVCYDAAGGALAAARAWWLLRSGGHDSAWVLDGGWRAAEEAGLATASGTEEPSPRPPYPVDGWRWPLVTADQVQDLLDEGRAVVFDVRAAERFRGETEPFDPVAGRIPGATNLPYTELLDDSGRLRPATELRALLAADRPLAVHCGSGITACQLVLAAVAADLPPPALYVGSWSEWCRSGRPVARGAA